MKNPLSLDPQEKEVVLLPKYTKMAMIGSVLMGALFLMASAFALTRLMVAALDWINPEPVVPISVISLMQKNEKADLYSLEDPNLLTGSTKKLIILDPCKKSDQP